MAQQVVTELVIDARSAAAGAAQYDSAMKKAETAAQRVTTANDNAQAAIQRSTVSMTAGVGRQAAAWNRLAAAADPVIAAQQRLEKATVAGNAAMAKGVATADQVSSVLGAYRARLDAVSAAQGKGLAATAAASGAVALNAGQVQNLTFQLNDMATMLASGQSPFVMMMQQGMQMAQVFGPGVGVGGALKATGAALVGFLTNPLTLAVVGIAAASGAVKLLWDSVSSSSSADAALEKHKALIDDIREAYGEAGEAATRYAAKSAEVMQFRTSDAMAENAAALNEALDKFQRMYEPRLGDLWADFGALNPLVQEFTQSIRDGNADVAAFERALAAVGNATDDIQTDAAVAEVLALIEPLLELERQARQTAGATQLFAGTLVTLGRAGTLRFADAFGDLEGMKSELTGFLDEQNRAGEAAARIATQRADAISGVIEQLRFEQEQLGRTAREQAIYNQLKAAGVTLDSAQGREIAALAGNLYDAEQAQKALNDRLRDAGNLATGFANSLVSGLAKGDGIIQSMARGISGMSSSLGKMASGLLSKIGGGGVFGSILSGVGGGLVSGLVSSIGSVVDKMFGNPELDAWRAMKGEVHGFIGELNKGTISLDQAKDQYREMIAAAEAAGQSGAKVDRLTRAFRRFKKEAEEAEKAARKAELKSTLQGYGDRAFVAGLDTSTMTGRLAQFDLEAQRERERVIEEGGKKLNKRLAALDAALAAERLAIQRDFNDRMIADAKRAADEMNQTARSIVDYVNGLKTGSDSPLSPVDRLAAAESTYLAKLALAQGGNPEALGSIPGDADAYIKAAREMYASSADFFAIFDQVTSQLLALPVVQGATAPDVVAMLQVLDAVQAQTDVIATTLVGAVNGLPAATATALDPLFAALDLDASGGITLAEMQTALGTTNAYLQSIFATLDADGDGQISRLEQISAATGPLASWLATVNATTGAVNAGVAGVNSGIGDVNTNVGKNDESGLKRWTKNSALATKDLGKGVVPWMRVFAGRLYEISLFSSQAKGAKGKPRKGDDRTVFSAGKKGGISSGSFDPAGSWAKGGIVGRYANGGVIGNGMWNVDSVLARYAGGGSVALAGGEGVINAAATSMIGPSVIDLMNRTGRLPDNDNGKFFDTQNRVLMAGFRAMVETMERLEMRLARLEAATNGTTRAVRDKPVPKPQTKVA